nr:hypothetical protein [uncultured Methanobrevibacter sp.]
MNKLALIGLSLLVLIIGFGFVSASDVDGSVQAVDDHGSIDEMDSTGDLGIQHDVSDSSSADHADDSQYEIADSSIADHADDNQYEPASTDLQTQQNADNSGTNYVDECGPSNTASQTNDTIGHAGGNNTNPNPDVLSDNVIRDSAVKVTNLTQSSSNQTPTTVTIIDDTPKETDTSAQKQDLLRPDIVKYDKYFKKNMGKTMVKGKSFSEMDLLLEIHKHYSFEDTIIIAMHVLRDNGYRVTFTGLEGMLKAMGDGTLHTWDYQMNSSYYKNEMGKIHESHKSLNIEAKKYSDMFNRKNGKLITERVNARYCYLDLIVEVFQKHSSLEDTILISTYALKNSGLNVTAASIENTINQMMAGTVHAENTECTTSSFYYIIMNTINLGHQRGIDMSDAHLELNDV